MSSTNSKSAPPGQRFHRDLAVAELPVAARLLFVAAVCFYLRGDRLAIRDARRLQRDLDAEAAAQFRHRHFDVELALAREQKFVRLRVALVVD
jgi:hypothetical protein